MTEFWIPKNARGRFLRYVLILFVSALMLGMSIGYALARNAYIDGNTNLDRIETTTVTLNDTRQVPCVVQNGYIQTCDWVHANGSDYID